MAATSEVETKKNFSLGESKTLLKIWGSAEFQNKFSSSGKRHTKIWLEIGAELYDQGADVGGNFQYPKRSVQEIKNKVNNEKKKYTKQVNALKSGAERPLDDPIFDIMDSILGCRPVTNTVGVSDSLGETPASEDIESDTSQEVEITATVQAPSRSPTEGQGGSKASRRRKWVDTTSHDVNSKMLKVQEETLLLNQSRHAQEEKVMSAMEKFFEAGANYFNSQVPVRQSTFTTEEFLVEEN